MAFTGVIGVEWLSQDMDEDSMAYGFATAIEESLEMLGAWLFLRVNMFSLQESQFKLMISGGGGQRF